MTVFSVSHAIAATSADCLPANTLTAPTDTVADLQLLLTDTAVSVICLSGTFAVGATLTYEHDVTLVGLSSAVLLGPGAGNGILATASTDTLTVQNISFTGGRALLFFGGAIFGDTVVVIDCVFDDNQAVRGGAIFAADLQVERSSFFGNEAHDGGALYAAQITANASTFNGNRALDSSRAISASELTVRSSTFDSNGAENTAKAVGAGDVDIRNRTFTGNRVNDASRCS